MISRCDDDPLLRALATLPAVSPDEAAARQVRARCRALLEQPPARLPIPLESASVGAVCVMYAWHIARVVLR